MSRSRLFEWAGWQRRNVARAALAVAVVVGAVFVAGGSPASADGWSGSHSGFLLGGNAQHAKDPENPFNEVIRINTLAPPLYGTVSRKLNVKIAALDNMLEFKSYFQNRSCGGGSPRIQLAIDLNGDGTADGNAFGYTAPPFAGCPPNRWQYDDLTDELPRWDLSQFAAAGFPAVGSLCGPGNIPTVPGITCPIQTHSGYVPWAVFETVLNALFPFHQVCTGALVDDSGWLAPAAGTAYYDVISLGRATWVAHADTAGRGFARGCGSGSHCDDDEHEGDKDRDHDHDHHDDEYDDDRRRRWDDD